MRRRATSGEMARGRLVFVFSRLAWSMLRCRACVDHRSGHAAPCHLRRDGTREVGFCFFFGGCSGVGRVLTTGVVMRRRATSGEMARGRLVFVFFWRLLRCRACVDHMEMPPGVVHAPARVPPQERWHEGGWFLFFLWRLLRCRACVDHRSGHAAPCHHGSGWHEEGWFLFFLWRLLRCRACVDHRSGHAAPCHHGSGWHEGGWFLFFSLEVAPVSEGDSFTR